jgi:mRNA interferase MazF
VARPLRRGDICWYEFQPPDKRRPVLILTRDSAIRVLNAVTVAPVTSTIRDIPSEVALSPDDGLPRPCAANFDNLQTVSKHKLGSRIATLSAEKMNEVSDALQFALGLS